MVGCSLSAPTSVSQCQQRSHFWPSARTTNSDCLSLVISNCETLQSSRNASSTALSAIHSESGLASAYKRSFASKDLPMIFARRFSSNLGSKLSRYSKSVFQSSLSASLRVKGIGLNSLVWTEAGVFPGTKSQASSVVNVRIGASILHKPVTSRYKVGCVER